MNKIISSAAVIGSVTALSAYYIITNRKTAQEIREEKTVTDDAAAAVAGMVWQKEVGVPLQALSIDVAMVNSLDALAVFRYANFELFKRAVVEIENFYRFYLYTIPELQRDRSTAFQFLPVSCKYVHNIEGLLQEFRSAVLDTYPATKGGKMAGALESRIKYRTTVITDLCNGYHGNFLKDCQTIAQQH